MAIKLSNNLIPHEEKPDEYLYELKCRNCGGALDSRTLKCPYCGSQYERKNEHMGDMVKTVYIQTCVPYVKIETQRDLRNMQQIIRGTVRVAEPDFRF